MIVVIIAGGSGTRLWPLSTPDYPKHLLKIGSASDSLLQLTYNRSKLITDKIYIASEASHIHHVRDQLPDLPEDAFVVEPDRRGTASCIVAALAKVSQEHGNDEPVAFMHADHFIQDGRGVVDTIKQAGEISSKTKQIVLVGIQPDYPATNFGYIQVDGDAGNGASKVNSFKEKPDKETAENYLASKKYLWNGGYFVATVDTFVREMQSVAPGLKANYDKLLAVSEDKYRETYLSFENIAIDYALIEKVSDLLVIPAQFDWMDVGSFGDLHTAIGSDDNGNHKTGNAELESVNNSIVLNYEDKPVAVIGLDNVAVINTPKGLIVTHKDTDQKVGEVSKRLLNRN